MPVLRAIIMVAFGLAGLGMLSIAVFAFIGAGQPFVGVLLALMSVVSFVIAMLMWQRPMQHNSIQREK